VTRGLERDMSPASDKNVRKLHVRIA
jgi:hypothetical protein